MTPTRSCTASLDVPGQTHQPRREPKVSVVLVYFEMQREIARTVRSLSPAMQTGAEPSDWEIIVVDNGSPTEPDLTECPQLGATLRVLRVEDGGVSPARAANAGIAAARGNLVGVMIDGARLASPGLVSGALAAAAGSPRPVVATLGYHLGPATQQTSVQAGYDQEAEDALLESVGWTEDGYRLFEISVLAESSRDGTARLPAESNAIFLSRELWAEIGGFDEAFKSPGGGLVNHDMLIRACRAPGADVFLLEGEATFHQVHGGVTTNNPDSRWEEFAAEYQRVRGGPYERPDVPFTVI
jgi:glycosyltransferase involved in cell wall biosynthesis